MSNQVVSTGGGQAGKVYKCVLTPNREDRPRYVVLVSYEAGTDGRLHPVRREYLWLRGEHEWAFLCVRVTELRWRAIQPQQAHVEMRDQWMAHVKAYKAKAKAVAKEADHNIEVAP